MANYFHDRILTRGAADAMCLREPGGEALTYVLQIVARGEEQCRSDDRVAMRPSRW